jgi:hypothetical protein
MGDPHNVADRATFTPAERALCVEQAQTAILALEQVITQMKDGTSGDAIRAYTEVHRATEYLMNVINQSIARTMQTIHDEEH